MAENRGQRRDEIRNQVRDNHPRLDFWSDHPNWAAWRINRPYRWATWGALTGWVGYGWSEPVTYAYGENVYYEDDSVYYGDQVVARPRTTRSRRKRSRPALRRLLLTKPIGCRWACSP